jgi:hypothetical protein
MKLVNNYLAGLDGSFLITLFDFYIYTNLVTPKKEQTSLEKRLVIA